ncbi:hypothetical protein ACFFP0_25545 [Rhizobium puerariae]|uniref:Transmembrane protein n=1 Tax=Rhizobium puerariae TaxID=1585791 RepID=A0ABV6ANM2_9HYPH
MNSFSDRRPAAAGLLKILSLLIIILGTPLGIALPGWWGWENGPVENIQAAILIFGLIHAVRFYRRSDDRSKWLWLAGIPLWFVLVAREFSFGATFLPPTAMSAHGPAYSVGQLPYKPFITPAVLVLIAFSVAIIVIKRLAELGLELAREGTAPWVSLGLVAVGMLLSSIAEGHMGIKLPFDGNTSQNIEEIIEFGAYLALWAAQFEIFHALSSRRPV